MIIATRIFIVQPEKRNENVAAMMKWSQVARQTPGCLTHGYYADLSDANTIRFYGEFDSPEAMKATTSNPKMAQYWEAMNESGVTIVDGLLSSYMPLADGVLK